MTSLRLHAIITKLTSTPVIIDTAPFSFISESKTGYFVYDEIFLLFWPTVSI